MSKGFRKAERLSSWRRIALHLWDKPRDPTVYGVLEIEMGRALDYLERVNAARVGARATVTHLVVKAIAKAIAANPESNALVSRRHLYFRETVDVYCQVAVDGGNDLSGVKVRQADRKAIHEIAAELEESVKRVQERRDPGSERTKQTVLSVPSRLLGPLLRAVEYLTYERLLDLSKLGIAFDQFGSAMVSNVGSFGIANGLAPLVPATRAPVVLLLGEVADRPVVHNGRVEVAPCMTIGCTFDHRVIDGYQAGKMARVVRQCLENPFVELGPPTQSSSIGDRLVLDQPGTSDRDQIGSGYRAHKAGFVREEDQPS
jgi:pyruvate/2-oxoglutarate dehydrogenase complex dihydrolipoamide acyltransferase (E2) component